MLLSPLPSLWHGESYHYLWQRLPMLFVCQYYKHKNQFQKGVGAKSWLKLESMHFKTEEIIMPSNHAILYKMHWAKYIAFWFFFVNSWELSFQKNNYLEIEIKIEGRGSDLFLVWTLNTWGSGSERKMHGSLICLISTQNRAKEEQAFLFPTQKQSRSQKSTDWLSSSLKGGREQKLAHIRPICCCIF